MHSWGGIFLMFKLLYYTIPSCSGSTNGTLTISESSVLKVINIIFLKQEIYLIPWIKLLQMLSSAYRRNVLSERMVRFKVTCRAGSYLRVSVLILLEKHSNRQILAGLCRLFITRPQGFCCGGMDVTNSKT